MSMYHCEGFVREVKISDAKVTFTLEPASPYLFEKKTDDGKTKKLLLLVNDTKTPNEASIYNDDQEFSAPEKCDLKSMLIAKANRLKVRIGLSLQSAPMPVEVLTVL